MNVCEKCWADAFMRARDNPHKSQVEHYHDLLWERRSNPCTADERETVSDDRDKFETALAGLITACEMAQAIPCSVRESRGVTAAAARLRALRGIPESDVLELLRQKSVYTDAETLLAAYHARKECDNE